MRCCKALVVMLLIGTLIGVLAQEKKAPNKLTFKAKMGDVVFNHEQHIKAAKNDCKVCHDKLWPQDAKAPLNYKAAMHKTAEAKHTSCGFCHHAGGASFASTGNCNKCHVKAGAKG